MINQLEELESSFIEEYESASILEKLGKIKSSLILYSKALFAIVDYIIFNKYKKLPKNHSDRFRILQEKETFIYNKLDSVWNKYTDAYKKPSDSESLLMLKNAILEIIKNERTSEKIRKAFENK